MPYYRPYVSGNHSSSVNTLATRKWPASTLVLWANDKIRVESDSTNTEYVVQSNVTSDGSGNATISIQPGLAESVADGDVVLVPAERTFTSAMRASIASENATLIYFMRFDFVVVKRITGYADNDGATTVTSAAHGLLGSDTQITLYGTNSLYDGTWTFSNKTTDTFDIPTNYIPGETGGGFSIDRPIYLCTAPHNVTWNSIEWIGIGGNVGFEALTETAELSGHGITQVLSGVEQSIISSVLNYTYYGRAAKTWLGHVGTDGNIIVTPKLIFWGRMNGGFEITEQREENKPGSVTVKGRFVDRFGDLQMVRGIQSNEESHQRFYPDDTFFKHVHALMNKKIIWGPATSK